MASDRVTLDRVTLTGLLQENERLRKALRLATGLQCAYLTVPRGRCRNDQECACQPCLIAREARRALGGEP